MSTPAPWVRTRLRTAPLAALLTAVLALTVVFLAAALPRAQDRSADRALRSYLSSQGQLATGVRAYASDPVAGDPAKALDDTAALLADAAGTVLPLAPGGPVYGSRAVKTRFLSNPWLSRPEGVSPEFALSYLHGLPEHARLTAGQWPGASADGEPIPVALSADAAAAVKADVGSVVDATGGAPHPQLRVVGLYTVDDRSAQLWADQVCAVKVCRAMTDPGPGEIPKLYWYATALAGPESISRLAAWGGSQEDFWRVPVQVDALRADRLRQTSFDLATVTDGPVSVRVIAGSGRPRMTIVSDLRRLIDGARQRQSAIDSVTAIGPAGAAGVGAVVLCLAAALTAERRTTELRLLRARGGSIGGSGGIVRLLLGEGALTVLPAAALGALLAFTLLPTPRWQPAALAAGSVTLLALLAFPLRAALLLRDRAGRGWYGRRRVMAELAVLAATVAAATQVLRRGVAPQGEGVDPLLVTAPLLLALTGALLLARLQPFLIGLSARWAGAAPERSASSAWPAPPAAAAALPPSVLPLLALVLAVACGAIGAAVLSSVKADRGDVARYLIGGDAMVRAKAHGALPDAFVTAAEKLPGVDVSLPVWIDDDVSMPLPNGSSVLVNVVLVDPVRYAKVAEVAGRGRFDPALLTARPGEPLPALVTSDLPNGEFTLRLSTGEGIPIRTVGTADGTPARSETAGITVLLPAGPASALMPRLGRPVEWLATGNLDDAQVHALAQQFLGPAATDSAAGHLAKTRTGVVAVLGSDPLQTAAERMFWVSVGITALFAVLSVLLTLLRAGPERAATLARLRTMGLRPRQGLALILAEALPQALVAALGGALAAAGCVLLIGPAVDVAPLVGAADRVGLRLIALPIVQQALGLAVLAALAVVAEAAVSARRQITTELRAGDTR
ncbi:hypothetical protein [Kitasatospora cheerisanensis]|uniref:ABC3 transporter permease protein domain-containing protein n=1 Tax=Kitasatospora cheerisanensis KCTC 2395 TaxID=1348663 RepID=A0A066Z2Q1_9ACTN|nr:hypothetical protein [Kitasatospora cheerisanensis]KDN86524.1 hypothetical protein KCH_16200 [Kitasatospora cheerisanensis KCTC 2395]